MKKEDISNLIKELIEKIGITTKNVSFSDENNSNTWFSVEVDEPHFFISHEGEALHALNHLIRRIVENKMNITENNDMHYNMLIDINDFQKKKVDAVRAIAHMMSERARYFKSNIEVDPMSAFERRIIHEFLADAVDLETESIGFGPNRRVVIKYKGAI